MPIFPEFIAFKLIRAKCFFLRIVTFHNNIKINSVFIDSRHIASSENKIYFLYYSGTLDEIQQQATNAEIAETAEVLPSEQVMQMEEDEKREQEEKKRSRDPPIVFKDSINISTEFKDLTNALDDKLNDEERTCMGELRQYVLENEGSWALGDNFLNFVGEI